MKLPIHSQTSTVKSLGMRMKCGEITGGRCKISMISYVQFILASNFNCEWISKFMLHFTGMWLHIHDRITLWGRVTHICVSKLTTLGSDNGLSPGRRQAIIWTSAVLLLIGHLGTNLREIFIEIHTFLFKKIHFQILSGKWRPICRGPNVLRSIHVSGSDPMNHKPCR